MVSLQIAVIAILVPLFQGISVDPKGASLLSFDEADAKKRPVTKVITLLKDMLTQMEKEADEDEEVYDKLACWCETGDKEKTKSISDAEARISELTTSIESFTSLSARLSQEIENLNKEVKADQEALDTATALRQKQVAEFSGEEKDLLESINSLKAANAVFSKNKAMIQVTKSHILGVAAALGKEMSKHKAALRGVLTPSARRIIGAFVQAPENYSYAQQSSKQPQSNEIQGILRQMQGSFEANLAATQKEETSNQQSFEELKAAKDKQIAAGQAQIDTKTQELAAANEKKAQAKQDLEDTSNSLEADQEFIKMLKEKCSTSDADWEERQKTRQTEMQACSKALAVLSSDDAHDTFTKTFNPASAFVQIESAVVSQRRHQASTFLVSMAAKLRSPRLATLAESVQINALDNVKKAIEDLISELATEKENEIKHKDFCVDEFANKDLETERKVREKADAESQVEDLKLTIKQAGEAIVAVQAEIAEAETQLKRAAEDRVKQQKDFQMTVADQRATQKLLQQAMTVLQGFYGKESKAVLLQTQTKAFAPYKTSGGAAGVMALLGSIIDDAKSMEADAVKGEEDAEKAAAAFQEDTRSVIEEKKRDVVHKTKTKAKAEGNLVQSEEDDGQVAVEIEQLHHYVEELHLSCDDLLKDFDVRQSARVEEMDALKQAVSMLSGIAIS